MLYAVLIHDEEHQVGLLAAELPTEASASDREERGCSHRTVFLAASENTAAEFAPDHEGRLFHSRKHSDALCPPEKAFRNALVRSRRGHLEDVLGRTHLVNLFVFVGDRGCCNEPS